VEVGAAVAVAEHPAVLPGLVELTLRRTGDKPIQLIGEAVGQHSEGELYLARRAPSPKVSGRGASSPAASPSRGISNRPSVARGLHSTKARPSSVTRKPKEIWPV
jgi:hypothetical protein